MSGSGTTSKAALTYAIIPQLTSDQAGAFKTALMQTQICDQDHGTPMPCAIFSTLGTITDVAFLVSGPLFTSAHCYVGAPWSTSDSWCLTVIEDVLVPLFAQQNIQTYQFGCSSQSQTFLKAVPFIVPWDTFADTTKATQMLADMTTAIRTLYGTGKQGSTLAPGATVTCLPDATTANGLKKFPNDAVGKSCSVTVPTS